MQYCSLCVQFHFFFIFPDGYSFSSVNTAEVNVLVMLRIHEIPWIHMLFNGLTIILNIRRNGNYLHDKWWQDLRSMEHYESQLTETTMSKSANFCSIFIFKANCQRLCVNWKSLAGVTYLWFIMAVLKQTTPIPSVRLSKWSETNQPDYQDTFKLPLKCGF